MLIMVEDVAELAKICAQLVREGVTFQARKDDTTKLWIIRFNGGF